MPLPRVETDVSVYLNHCKSVEVHTAAIHPGYSFHSSYQVTVSQCLSFDHDDLHLKLDQTMALHGIPMAEAFDISTQCSVTVGTEDGSSSFA